MTRLDDLPPDLRATLSLLVDRGKSYAQVAELLGIPESAVRDRAHAALDALAGTPGGLDSPPPARPPEAGSAPPAPSSRIPGPPPVSRRGGALLLAGIVVVIAIVVVLVTSGGGSGNGNNSSKTAGTGTTTPTTSSTSTSASTKASASKATPTNQIALTSPEPSSKAIGIVEILAEGSKHAFYLAAEHLPPTSGFFYVIWLYNSPTNAEAISKTTVASDGRTQGGALLPSNAGEYHRIIVTRETGEHATSPGPIVLSGTFSLTGG